MSGLSITRVRPQAFTDMTSLASLSRPALERLADSYRPSEAQIVGAQASEARSRADRLKRQWTDALALAKLRTRAAAEIGREAGFKGASYADAHGAAHAAHGVAKSCERLYLRAERAAQTLERDAARLRRGGLQP